MAVCEEDENKGKTNLERLLRRWKPYSSHQRERASLEPLRFASVSSSFGDIRKGLLRLGNCQQSVPKAETIRHIFIRNY